MAEAGFEPRESGCRACAVTSSAVGPLGQAELRRQQVLALPEELGSLLCAHGFWDAEERASYS